MGASAGFLRLDGSVPTSARHGIVARFNADPSIDVVRGEKRRAPGGHCWLLTARRRRLGPA